MVLAMISFYIKCRKFFDELYETYKGNTHTVSKVSMIQIMRFYSAFQIELILIREINKCIHFQASVVLQ